MKGAGKILVILLSFLALSTRGQKIDWDTLMMLGDKEYKDTILKLCADTSYFFPQKKFSYAVGYTFNKRYSEEGINTEYSIIDLKTKHIVENADKKVHVLTQLQTESLLSIINDSTNFEWGSSGCFIPHQAFVFYNKENKVVAAIDVCFLCKNVNTNPRTACTLYGGLSDKGLKKLHDLCEQLEMIENKKGEGKR